VCRSDRSPCAGLCYATDSGTAYLSQEEADGLLEQAAKRDGREIADPFRPTTDDYLGVADTVYAIRRGCPAHGDVRVDQVEF